MLFLFCGKTYLDIMPKELNYFVPTLNITNFINQIYPGEKEKEKLLVTQWFGDGPAFPP